MGILALVILVGLAGRVDAFDVKQGRVALIPCEQSDTVVCRGIAQSTVVWRGKSYALVVVSMFTKPGVLEVKVNRHVVYLRVVKTAFEVSYPERNYVEFTDTNKSKFKIALLAEPAQQLWDSFVWPLPDSTNYPVSSSFGRQRRYLNRPKGVPHLGIDWEALRCTPVRAAANGVVLWANDSPLLYEGPTVVIAHGGEVYTYYLHLAETVVKTGDFVFQGQVIGFSGGVGANSTGDHLDFRVRVGRVFVDPPDFIKLFR